MEFLDLANFKKFVSFKSISTDSSFDSELRECCNWLSNYLRSFCDEVWIFETRNKPVVIASCIGRSEDRNPLAIYGHYDVQPARMEEGWISDPFELTERDGRLYARGAQDNKGQLWYSLQAVKRLKECGQLNRKVFFIIEGEEESGGQGSQAFIKERGKEILEGVSCVLVVDSGSVSESLESITLGVRGVAWLEFIVEGPGSDLHSGVHGGLAPNPISEVSRLLTLMFSDGFHRIHGFFEGCQGEPSSDYKNLVSLVELNDESYARLIGAQKATLMCHPFLLAFYPWMDAVGVYGGYSGTGIKNVIPSYCGVKLSIRTALGQSSAKVLESVRNFVQQHIDPHFRLKIIDEGVGGNPVLVPYEDPRVQKIMQILKNATGNPIVPQWMGASIPIVEVFNDICLLPIMMGFGLEGDNIHGPNESFKISQMEKGFRVLQEIIQRF